MSSEHALVRPGFGPGPSVRLEPGLSFGGNR